MNFFWESIIMVTVGMLLLRAAGRKSISQMTIAQTVVMISIGSIIIQPIVEHSVWRTAVVAGVFIAFLVFMEFLQLKFNFMEKFITGKSVTVIENGRLVTDNMRKMRFTVDQLEMRLRQQGIAKMSDVKTATLEPNGQIGYELMRHAQPLTIGEFEKMLGPILLQSTPPRDTNIFDEVRKNGHPIPNPKHLQ